MTQDSNATGSLSSPSPAFSSFASFSTPSGSQSMTPQPPAQQAFQPPAATAAPVSVADPFAALTGPSNSQPSAVKTTTNDDDEWNFSSALPEASGKPKEQRASLVSTNLRVDYIASRSQPTAKSLALIFAFSNNLAQPIRELHFQLAVTKVRIDCSSFRSLVYTSVLTFLAFQGLRASTEAPDRP